MRYCPVLYILLPLLFFAVGCSNKKTVNANHDAIPDSSDSSNVVYAGVRSSYYGINPFPEPKGWEIAIDKMAGYYTGAIPCAIWIVGGLEGSKGCRLEFPADSKHYPNIQFYDYDKHEAYLSYFDKTGIKVFLQVEPGHACVDTLIDLVLNRYKKHPSVIGFGVDVEWYREADYPEWGAKVKDDTAKTWEARVKSHNSAYRLFLKHWDRGWMPPKYRGDIIFVDDSQQFDNFDHMVNEFVNSWAAFFKPNMVFFQIGYEADRPWWSKFTTPPQEMGTTIADSIDQNQNCGIFWVDFTLKEVLPVK